MQRRGVARSGPKWDSRLKRSEATETMPPQASSAMHARGYVERLLGEWDCDPDLTERAVLVANELLTNVARHAGTDADLTIRLVSGGIRIEVTDGSTAPARIHEPVDPLSVEGGRGLILVRELSADWGMETRAGGKTVWAELYAR